MTILTESLLRMVATYHFLLHGTAKLFALPHIKRFDGLSWWLLPLLNGGEGAVLFCFIFLYLAAAGGGRWSLDHYLARA